MRLKSEDNRRPAFVRAHTWDGKRVKRFDAKAGLGALTTTPPDDNVDRDAEADKIPLGRSQPCDGAPCPSPTRRDPVGYGERRR